MKMRRYLGVVSIFVFIVTILYTEVFLIGKVSGAQGTKLLLIGVGVSILLVIFSEKGRVKTIVLSLYGLLIVGFITIVILYGVSHM
jgi:hypothetical protein